MGTCWPRRRPHPRCQQVITRLDALSREVEGIAATVKRTEEHIVSGLTDLNTAIAAEQAEWTTFLADLTTALGNEDSDAAVEAAAQLVQQQTAAMTASDPVTGTTPA